MSDEQAIETKHQWQTEDLTGDMAPHDIQNALSRYNRAWKIKPNGENQPRALVGSRLIGDVLLTDMHLYEMVGERDDELVEQESEVYIGVTCPYEGSAVVHADGEEYFLDPSKMQLWASSHPVEFTVDTCLKFVCILFPEKRLYKRIPGFEGRAFFFDSNQGEVQLIRSHLLTLARISQTTEKLQETCVSEATIELLANLLRSNENFSAATSRKDTLRDELSSFILQHLTDSELKPAMLADKFGLSLRSIHKLFSDQNTTVMRFIKDQRLESAYCDLADPFLKDASITDICYKWAFSDAAHFSHAFKEKYGASPSEYRRSEAQKKEP
jgi:AraC family transcriptional activator of tynA and feaB